MKSWIWLYLARRQMLDKSDITFVGRQKRLKLRQICHHICPRQMYNKCIINTTPHLLKDKYRVKLNKFEAENSDVLIAIYISPHWLLSVFLRVNVWVWVVEIGVIITTQWRHSNILFRWASLSFVTLNSTQMPFIALKFSTTQSVTQHRAL